MGLASMFVLSEQKISKHSLKQDCTSPELAIITWGTHCCSEVIQSHKDRLYFPCYPRRSLQMHQWAFQTMRTPLYLMELQKFIK
jgi:hypothetical protein